MFLVIVALVILSHSQADKDMDKGAGTGLACLAAAESTLESTSGEGHAGYWALV
jgi:hypothetical protein